MTLAACVFDRTWLRRLSRVGLAVVVLGGGGLGGVAWADAPKWTEASAAELSMKDDPKAPGVPAVVLSIEKTDDGVSGEVTLHERIKVLTDGGLTAGNIELMSASREHYLEVFDARTIHADGTVIPYVKDASNTTTTQGKLAVGLAQVQVGSIVEYVAVYTRRYAMYSLLTPYFAPVWTLQSKYFIHSEHLTLNVPPNLDIEATSWVANLPRGAQLKRTKNRIDLLLTDVPARPDEAYMPPASATLYNVRFFYHNVSRDKYWGETGSRVDYYWSGFDVPTKGLTAAVQALIQPADDDEAKLRKIYTAVQGMENTDLTRKRLEKEDAKAGVHTIRSSEDIWNSKRADSEMLTLLFIAMAKAAGYQAYPMAVSSRNDALFNQDVLSWAQVDSTVAIVVVKGREVFFDPGTKMCPFARMAPWHSNVAGVSTEAKLVKIRMTPQETSKNSRRDRGADVTLAADGSVTGTIVIRWTGTAGLELRQEAVRDDLRAVKGTIRKQTQALVPEGLDVKLSEVTGLEDAEEPLVARFTISGKMGQATKKRFILPAQFFASTAKPMLTGDTRTQPIAFPNASVAHDQMRLHLPEGFTVESLPAEQSASLFQDSQYGSSASAADGVITTQRTIVLNRIDYKADEYANLHHYFSQVEGVRSGSNSGGYAEGGGWGGGCALDC